MARYLIESSHTPEECLRSLDEVLAKGPELLSKFDWGCDTGIHTGWAIVDAGSDSAARDMLPNTARPKSRVVRVERLTPERIKAYHTMK